MVPMIPIIKYIRVNHLILYTKILAYAANAKAVKPKKPHVTPAFQAILYEYRLVLSIKN